GARRGGEARGTLLGHEEQSPVGVIEKALADGAVGGIPVNGTTQLLLRRAIPPQGGERGDEVRRLAWWRRRAPAQRVRRGRGLIEAAGNVAVIDAPETVVNRRRPDAVQP